MYCIRIGYHNVLFNNPTEAIQAFTAINNGVLCNTRYSDDAGTEYLEDGTASLSLEVLANRISIVSLEEQEVRKAKELEAESELED